MRIPFEISVDDINEAAGFLYLEDDYLVFEYHILKWGVIRGEHAIVKTERGVIDELRVRRGLFKDRLVIATHSLKLLQEIPGRHASEIELRVKKRYRREVEAFLQKVLSWKNEKAV